MCNLVREHARQWRRITLPHWPLAISRLKHTPSLCNRASANYAHICTTFNLWPPFPWVQASAKVTLPSNKQSASLGAAPTPLHVKSEPCSVADSCSTCLQPLPLRQQQRLSMGQQLFPPSIKALIPLIRLFIQCCTGSLLILGHMGHWKISDCKVFMRRHSQSRGARVQMLCPFLCQHLDTAQAVIFLLEQKTHLHSQRAACRA